MTSRSGSHWGRLRFGVGMSVLAGALTVLALFRRFDLTAFLLLFGAAFVAYGVLLGSLRRGALPLRFALGAALLIRLPWLAAPPLLSDDVWRYLHDGRAQVAGVNPYRHPPAAPEADAYAGPERARINNPELPTIYPPAAQLAFRLAAAAGATLLAWKLLLLSFDLAIGLAVGLCLRARGGPPGAAAVYLLHPLPVIEFAGNGHVDALGILGLVLALGLVAIRPVASGVALAVSVAAKFLALPVFAFAARQLAGRRRVAILAAGAGTLLLLYLPFADYLSPGSLRTFVRHFEFNASLYALLRLAFPPVVARWMLGAGLVAVLGLLWYRRAGAERAALVWLGALLLASPIIHPWYVTWLIPFLAWRREPWVLVWTGTVVSSYAVLPRWHAEGVWDLPAWVPWVEYAPVYGLLAWRAIASARARWGDRRERWEPNARPS